MMFLLFFPLLFLLPVAFLWMMRPDSGLGGTGGMRWAPPAQTSAPVGPDPMDIARQRLARGGITPAEFDEIRRALG